MKRVTKPQKADYRVYVEDTDGSERLGCVVYDAPSQKQARITARQAMLGQQVKILSVEMVQK